VTMQLFERIGDAGYSRVIVYDSGEALGYLVVKEMLTLVRRYVLGGVDGRKLRGLVTDLPMHPLEYFDMNVSVLDALGRLKSGASRIAAVTKDGFSRSGVMGFFSMEDVMEAIIQEEIEDEKDYAKFYIAKRATTANSLGANISVIGTTVGLF
ncbi:MAM3, partial [Symbiodinium microadriaticum]